jgi:hypothetical protein
MGASGICPQIQHHRGTGKSRVSATGPTGGAECWPACHTRRRVEHATSARDVLYSNCRIPLCSSQIASNSTQQNEAYTVLCSRILLLSSLKYIKLLERKQHLRYNSQEDILDPNLSGYPCAPTGITHLWGLLHHTCMLVSGVCLP